MLYSNEMLFCPRFSLSDFHFMLMELKKRKKKKYVRLLRYFIRNGEKNVKNKWCADIASEWWCREACKRVTTAKIGFWAYVYRKEPRIRQEKKEIFNRTRRRKTSMVKAARTCSKWNKIKRKKRTKCTSDQFARKNIEFHIQQTCCWWWRWHRFAARNDRDEEIWSLKYKY